MDNRSKTLFIDIDGTLLKHHGVGNDQSRIAPELLPGVRDRFDEWDRKGYRFILVTGRHESERLLTEQQLRDIGIVYDQLIMGIGGGQRVLINDYKLHSTDATAVAICIERNKGIEGIEV